MYFAGVPPTCCLPAEAAGGGVPYREWVSTMSRGGTSDQA